MADLKQLPGKPAKSKSFLSLRHHAWIGIFAVVFLFGGLGVWAATTEIAGAVVASGLIVVEGGSKRVQHQEGGIVKEILVQNEDEVKAGDLLVRLDGTTIEANLSVIISQLSEALATQARLTAESIGSNQIERPEVIADWPNQDELNKLFAAQEKLLVSRKASLDGQDARLAEQVTQVDQQIAGLEAQKAAVQEQLDLATTEFTDVEKLFKQGLVQLARVNDLKREQARLAGSLGSIESDIAAARASITERRVVNAQSHDDFQSQVLEDLQTASGKVAELMQQKIAAEDRLARLEIRAPQSGVIHESIIQTVGGVAGAGETLMMVVPKSDQLVIDARVSPLDIDKIFVGQGVAVRMSSLNTRLVPELEGTVRSLSPDLTQDKTTGQHYFVVRIAVPDEEVAKLPEGTKLGPGMPADIFAQTGDRTVLAYMMQPLTEQITRTFRED